MLVKMTILPFDDSGTIQIDSPSGPAFVVQFNPETYTDTTEVELAPTEPAHGDAGQEAKFKAIKAESKTFEFVLDGTGYSPAASPPDGSVPSSGNAVVDQIKAFRHTTGFAGNVHRPRYLMLVWGKLAFKCVLESYSITYKLFTPDGLPLRAVISANFKEHKDPTESEREKNLASPDIEHAHVIRSADKLPTLVGKVFRTPKHTVAVAEANGLNTLRRLKEGETLILPPLR